MSRLILYDPTVEGPREVRKLNPRVSDLNGKVIGFRIQWSRFDLFMDRVEELLRQKYSIPQIIRIEAASHQTKREGEEGRKWEEFKAKVDTAIVGLAA